MIPRRLLPAAAAMAALALVPALAGAQDVVRAPQEVGPAQGIGLKVTGGLHALTGDDFGDAGLDLGSAFGAEAVVSNAWAGGLELGVGVGIGFHEPGFGPDPSGDLITVFAEPLYRFRAVAERTPHVHPFIGARVGWARLNLDTGDPGGDVSANGFQGGALGGLEFWLTNEVALLGSVGFDFLSFGDLTNGVDVDGDGPSGGRLGLQGGMKVRFP